MAAVLAVGPDAVLSHLSAAALWGMMPPRSRHPDVTTTRRLHRPRIHFHHSYLPDDETTLHEGIPTTTVSRTLFDVAGVVSVHQFRRAVHEAEIRRLWDSLSLAHLLERHPRRPGAAAVREVIGSPDAGITRGIFEERFLDFLAANQFKRPATNVAFHLGDRFIEADCVWWEERVIVELDDHTTHGTRFAYERDRARDRALTAAGWRVIRITWRHLSDEPEAVAADLRAALERGAIAESLSRQGRAPGCDLDDFADASSSVGPIQRVWGLPASLPRSSPGRPRSTAPPERGSNLPHA